MLNQSELCIFSPQKLQNFGTCHMNFLETKVTNGPVRTWFVQILDADFEVRFKSPDKTSVRTCSSGLLTGLAAWHVPSLTVNKKRYLAQQHVKNTCGALHIRYDMLDTIFDGPLWHYIITSESDYGILQLYLQTEITNRGPTWNYCKGIVCWQPISICCSARKFDVL